MNRMVKKLVEEFAPSYTTYRFDTASNFVSYEQYCEDMIKRRIISLGEELKRIEYFQNSSNEDLEAMQQAWHDVHHEAVDKISIEDRNHIYYKKIGIDASNEIARRKDEEYAIAQGWR